MRKKQGHYWIILFALLYLVFALDHNWVFADIFGKQDQIKEYYQFDANQTEIAERVALIVPSSSLTLTNNLNQLQTEKFIRVTISEEPRIERSICPNSGFDNQIRVEGGNCTGFLVGSNLLATAGHCFEANYDFSNFVAVFGYQMNLNQTVNEQFSPDEVYSVSDIVAYSFNADAPATQPPFPDYAILELNGIVSFFDPEEVIGVNIRQEGNPEIWTRVGSFGYPLGLPQKMIVGEFSTIRKVEDGGFYTDLDLFKGSSGSPVVNQMAGFVEGIYVEGSLSAEEEFSQPNPPSTILPKCVAPTKVDEVYNFGAEQLDLIEDDLFVRPNLGFATATTALFAGLDIEKERVVQSDGTFAVTLTLSAEEKLDDIVLRDVLPVASEIDEISHSGVENGQIVSWTIPEINSAEVLTVTYTFSMTDGTNGEESRKTNAYATIFAGSEVTKFALSNAE